MVFICDSTTFATDPRVVESVTGSVPVEHPHYCVTQRGFVDMAEEGETDVKMTGRKETFVDNYQTLNVNILVTDHVPVAVGQPQKKVSSPIIV